MAKKFLLVFGLFMATMVCSASITPLDFQTGYEITGSVLGDHGVGSSDHY